METNARPRVFEVLGRRMEAVTAEADAAWARWMRDTKDLHSLRVHGRLMGRRAKLLAAAVADLDARTAATLEVLKGGAA